MILLHEIPDAKKPVLFLIFIIFVNVYLVHRTSGLKVSTGCL